MRYQSLQALRALAALMVLVFHSALVIPEPDIKATLWRIPGLTDFGFLGVNLFFVISGFIIASVLSRNPFSYFDYFQKRFFRIYPLLWAAMLMGLYHFYMLKWFTAEFVQATQTDAWGLLKSALIFPQEAKPFWQPAWTLEHEVLFYIIAAAVAPLFGLRALAVLLLGLGTVGIVKALPWDFHLFADAQIYFAAGIAAYLLKGKPLRLALPIALLALVVAYARLYGFVSYGPGVFHYILATGCAALIISFLQIEQLRCPIPKPLVALGDASYSLYILHWMLIPIAGTFRDIFGGSAELWRWTFVGVSIFVALLSYQIFEKPIIDFSQRRSKKRQARPSTAIEGEACSS